MGRLRGVVAFTFSMFVLLAGVLVVLPVEQAEADSVELGPDGYFSALVDTDGDGQILPIVDKGSETPQIQDGWENTQRIVFGKTQSSGTYQNASVSGGYKTLAFAKTNDIASEPGIPDPASPGLGSNTTALQRTEVLLWADDVVTTGFKFDPTGSCVYASSNCVNPFDKGSKDDTNNLSNAAVASLGVGDMNYSPLEKKLIREAPVEGVCTVAAGCGAGSYVGQQSESINQYAAFPLSIGDLRVYFNHTYAWNQTPDLKCSTSIKGGSSCANGAAGSWWRSARWDMKDYVFTLGHLGASSSIAAYFAGYGLRPAVRLNLEQLLLSAHSEDQSQELNAPNSSSPDSLRLTFMDAETSVVLTGKPTIEQEPGVGGEWVLKDLEGSSNLESQSGLGWKLVDPEDTSGEVVASGRTNYDAAAGSDGNMVVPCETLTPGRDYLLSVWGQEDGSDVVGWSNRATRPVTGTVRADGAGGCGPLDMPVAEPFGIALTGQTSGTLTAYRIGEYAETVFTQSGALKSVRLDTPTALKDTLKAAAVAAGGSDVDAGNPIGWVAARWLGYPTDPASDDVTSAFSPYAGQLQLFAQALAEDTSALGAAAGSLPKLDGGPETLKVSGPGLYLIVDSTQGSGGSLPIIVGTKVFNDALGDDGGFVDFADAGVKGKPRLGQAVLKTSITDVSKRIVNDAGLDGFDVGSSVEFEVALRVPDLSSFTSVAYDSYKFNLTDVAASGLTLPADGSGVEVFVDALSPTEPQSLPPGSIAVSGDTLSVGGLKVLFAESDGVSGVKNKNTVPVGSLMRLRYRAVLNASAVVSSPVEGDSLKPNVNAVTLTRSRIGEVSNGWTDAGAGLESKAPTANAYTFKLDVVKLDKDDLSTRLGGVEFEVSRDGEPLKFVGSAGVYRLAVGGETGSATVTTKADGTLSLQGVEARELSFKETNAPSGYFRVSDFTVDIRPEWNEDATQITKVTYATSGTNLAYVSQEGKQVVVLDPAWSLANLPYTGGVGILVLLIVGGLMLVFAIRPYILSKRAERDANLV
jgi:hypothetical protein